MTAKTAQQFEEAALAAVAQFPAVARLVQAGDPRIMARIRAEAAMLAMLSEQVEVASYEPFVKARDATVLADATHKGILPLARACRATLSVTNGDASAFNLAAGRRFLDPKGRIFTVDASVTIAAGATVTVAVTQQTTRVVTHTVAAATPYYRVEVPATADDVYLVALTVRMDAVEFRYAPDWFNVAPNELAYQVETDERRRLWVCMGATDVIGYGVATGDEIELTIGECEGQITDLKPADEFALEYAYTPADGLLKATLATVVDQGAAPPSMADLRVMARYPSIYDHDAVYLGEFEFLLRRYLSSIRFLSVWNEQVEEAVRGADERSVNNLFVSGLVTGMTDAAFRERVAELIQRADDSYGVEFVQAVLVAAAVRITGRVAVVHDPATVEAQIRATILAQYGDGQPDVSRGQSNPLRLQAIAALLRANVPAFQDDLSDFKVEVDVPGTTLATFTRASSASYVDSNGVVRTVAADVPRNPPAGLLIEAAATNLLLRSAEFDNASWTKTNCSVIANDRAGPDRNLSADRVTVSSTNASVSQAATTVAATVYSASFHVNRGTARWFMLEFTNAGGTVYARKWFDLQTGVAGAQAVAGSATVSASSIQALGDGYYRINLEAQLPGTTAATVRLAPVTADNTTTGAAAGVYFWLWGAQLALGALSSYIATAGATATRAADTASRQVGDVTQALAVGTHPHSAVLPEHFIHVSGSSLTVSVQRADYNSGLWNH